MTVIMQSTGPNMNEKHRSIRQLAVPLLFGLLGLVASGVRAQTSEEPAEAGPEAAVADGPIEEIVVIGRYKSAATDVVSERVEAAVLMQVANPQS